MPPVIIAAAVAGTAAVGGALISSSAANHASNVAQQAATSNNALQSQIYSSNSANEQPYIQAGDKATTALNGFLGLGGDAAASKAAFDNYLASTGYQFNRQQGLDAVTQSQAASGLLNSGATLKALDAYGTGEADQYGQQYVDNLSGVANRGVGGANALAGQGQSYANAVSSNNNSAATASGNAAISNANTINGLIGNALGAYALTRGQSSFGGGGGGGGTGTGGFGSYPVGG